MRIQLVATMALASAWIPLAWGGAQPRERDDTASVEIHYRGTLELWGHFSRPGESRTFHSEQRTITDGHGNVRLEWSTWTDADTARSPENFLIAGARVFTRSAPGARWRLLDGERARLASLQARAGVPWELARALPPVPGSRSAGLATPVATGELAVRAGRARRWIDHRAHPRLGDVEDEITWSYADEARAPVRMQMVLHERDHHWKLDQRRVLVQTPGAIDSLLRAPVEFDPPAASTDSLVGSPEIFALAPGVFAAEMQDINSRSLIVEFDDYLALIEVATSSANGERLVDAAKQRWPEKPFRYVFFSHHHPHYLGGLRALIAEGATVVTTPGNAALVREIAALPFRLQPDRQAHRKRRPQVRTIRDRFEIADGTGELVALDYGARSQHTDEFVVFWIPRARLLFEAELGWVPSGGTTRASRRARALLEFIDETGIEVDRIVQSWPMRDVERELSIDKLEMLVQAAHP